VDGPRDLQRIISSTPVGRTVKLKLWREGKSTELDVVVGAYEGGRPARRAPLLPPPGAPQPPK
jgi:hypothetical protein